jgi:hypothetical protein
MATVPSVLVATGAGLFVSLATGAGLFVSLATGAGLFVSLATGAGLFVSLATGAGLFARLFASSTCSAGTQANCTDAVVVGVVENTSPSTVPKRITPVKLRKFLLLLMTKIARQKKTTKTNAVCLLAPKESVIVRIG